MDKLDMILKELAEIKSLLAVNKRAPSIPWQEKFMMWQDYRNGVKVKDIAKYYNVSVPSVYQWIKTMPGQREFDNLFGSDKDHGERVKWIRDEVEKYKQL
jgi:hypothetical protein